VSELVQRHTAEVVRGDDLQAYSFMNGTVCVTERLALLLDDDELAFVLAHELAHLTLRHQVDRVAAEEMLQASAPDAVRTAAMGLHDRHAELEADKFGALYAVRAGFRFSASHEALAKIDAAPGDHPVEDAAHPAYAARIEQLKGFRDQLERCVRAFERGRDALARGAVGEAVDSFTLFVATFPESVAGEVNLGSALLARARGTAGTPEGLAEELPILPEPGVVVRGTGSALDVDRAYERFRRARELALSTDDAAGALAARAGLALVQLRRGERAEAKQELNEVAHDPGWRPEALLSLGNAEFLDGRFRQAADAYEQALRARPAWPAALYNLGRAAEQLGEMDRARALWATVASDAVYGEQARRRLGRRPSVVFLLHSVHLYGIFSSFPDPPPNEEVPWVARLPVRHASACFAGCASACCPARRPACARCRKPSTSGQP
jgi:predicted Zn-dependent protease